MSDGDDGGERPEWWRAGIIPAGALVLAYLGPAVGKVTEWVQYLRR